MRKIMLCTIMLLAVVLGMTACGGTDVSTTTKYPVSSDIPVPADKEQTDNDQTEINHVELIKIQGDDFGDITIPHIIGIESESISQANALFDSIRDELLANNEEFIKMTGDYPDERNPDPLCVSKYSCNGDILSIVMEYHYYFAAPNPFYEAVNINISTGEAIDPHEVIAAAGYTEDDVKNALLCYAQRSLTAEWERNLCYEFASRGERIDGVGDPSYGWQEPFNVMLSTYETAPEAEGNVWADLPRYPKVFLDADGGLYVCAEIPTFFDGGYWDQYWSHMVCIGHDDLETLRLNPTDPYGELFGKGMMTEDAACAAVAHKIGLDETGADADGIQYLLTVDRMEMIEHARDGIFPAYIVQVSKDEGTQIIALYEYAVLPLTGEVYEMIGESWILSQDDTDALTETLLAGTREEGALAAIYSSPDEYELWSAQPVADIDLTPYGSEFGYPESGGETSLLIAAQDGTTFSFETGMMGTEAFEPLSQIFSVTLNKGESIILRMLRPEGMPTQAVIVSTEEASGMLIITYDGSDGDAKIGYILPEHANE